MRATSRGGWSCEGSGNDGSPAHTKCQNDSSRSPGQVTYGMMPPDGYRERERGGEKGHPLKKMVASCSTNALCGNQLALNSSSAVSFVRDTGMFSTNLALIWGVGGYADPRF